MNIRSVNKLYKHTERQQLHLFRIVEPLTGIYIKAYFTEIYDKHEIKKPFELHNLEMPCGSGSSFPNVRQKEIQIKPHNFKC